MSGGQLSNLRKTMGIEQIHNNSNRESAVPVSTFETKGITALLIVFWGKRFENPWIWLDFFVSLQKI